MYISKIAFYFANVFVHLFCYFMFCIMPLKKDWRFSKRTTIILTTATVLSFCLQDILFFEKGAPFLNLKYVISALTLFFVFGYSALIIKKHYFQMVFIIMVCYTFHTCLSSISAVLFKIIPLHPLIDWFPQLNNLVIQVVVLALFVYPMWFLSTKLFSKVIDVGIDFTQWRLILLLPLFLLAFAIIFEGTIICKVNELYAELLLLILYISVAYITYFSMLKLLIISEAKHKEKQMFAVAQKQIELQKVSFEHLNANLAESARARHDWRQHYQAMRTLIKSGDFEKAEEYFAQYDKIHTRYEEKSLCDNKVIDAILQYYISDARAYGAEVTSQINIPAIIAIDELELCVCIGNIVENAVDACKRQNSGAKFIDIKANIVGKQLVLIVSNSFDGEKVVVDGELVSSKISGRKGIGIDSVKKIVEKNGGDIKIEHNNGKFKVSVILNL